MRRAVLVAAGIAVVVAAVTLARRSERPEIPTSSAPVASPPPAPRSLPPPPAPPPAALEVRAPAQVPPTAELDLHDENGEPIIQTGRFAGWTRSAWRAWYGERLDQMRRELKDAEHVLAAAGDGGLVSDDALGEARMKVRDLGLRIRFDEHDLDELDRLP